MTTKENLSGYYFAFDGKATKERSNYLNVMDLNEDDEPIQRENPIVVSVFVVSKKAEFDQTGYLEMESGSLEPLREKGFEQTKSNFYSYMGTTDEAKKILTDLGMTENTALANLE